MKAVCLESVSYELSGRLNYDCINEPLYNSGNLWHLGNNMTNSAIHINYCGVREIISQGSSTVVVAVLDSGVANHDRFL